jgi:hypothetical protein
MTSWPEYHDGLSLLIPRIEIDGSELFSRIIAVFPECDTSDSKTLKAIGWENDDRHLPFKGIATA